MKPSESLSNSFYADQTRLAERELSAFIAAVTELFGPDQVRRLDGVDATSAAYEVGYESVSQFNREYSRFFGPTSHARCQSSSNEQCCRRMIWYLLYGPGSQ